MSAPKDCAGRELKVGQKVAYCMAGTSQDMRLARIKKISPKMVSLDVVRSQWDNDLTRYHHAVCIVEDIQ